MSDAATDAHAAVTALVRERDAYRDQYRKLEARKPQSLNVIGLLLHPEFLAGTMRLRFNDEGHDPSELRADTLSRNIILSVSYRDGGLPEEDDDQGWGGIVFVYEDDDCDGWPTPKDWTPSVLELEYPADLVPPR